MSFPGGARLGGVGMRGAMGQTYQDQILENARYRLVAAQGQYEAAKRTYESTPSDDSFRLLQAAADAVVAAQRQVAGAQDASNILILTKSASGAPLANIKVSAFAEDGRDLVVPGTPKITGPGGRLELLIDSHAVETTRKILIRPLDSGPWTPPQKELDVSAFVNEEVVFTQGEAPSGGLPAAGGAGSYSPFILIGGLAVAAAIIYFAQLD